MWELGEVVEGRIATEVASGLFSLALCDDEPRERSSFSWTIRSSGPIGPTTTPPISIDLACGESSRGDVFQRR